MTSTSGPPDVSDLAALMQPGQHGDRPDWDYDMLASSSVHPLTLFMEALTERLHRIALNGAAAYLMAMREREGSAEWREAGDVMAGWVIQAAELRHYMFNVARRQSPALAKGAFDRQLRAMLVMRLEAPPDFVKLTPEVQAASRHAYLVTIWPDLTPADAASKPDSK